eukprot:COSAG06_NODE_38220_length_426_cov_0.342508_1_plen_55_part_01
MGSSDDEGDAEFVVERIVSSRPAARGRREFLVRWKDFGRADDTWEPEQNLRSDCP